jgi:transposase
LTTLENHEGNIGHLSEKMTHNHNRKRDVREYRRSLVLELDSQGYTHREIVAKLQISKGTVTNDLAYLRKQAQNNLQYHIHEVIPEYYQKCLWGMKRTLKQTLEIAETSSDSEIKLDAMKIANDCYRYIMDLTTDGVIVNDALRIIQSKINVLNGVDTSSSTKSDEIIITEDELKEKTTNGVF